MFTRPRGPGKIATRHIMLALLLGTIILQFTLPSAESSHPIIRVPVDFPSIQDAVNAAHPGDTVLVAAGVYTENLLITKSLSLTGESRDTTILDAGGIGQGIRVNATINVIVSGFTIMNTAEFEAGIVVSYSSQVSILGNKVQTSTTSNGTRILDSDTVTVRDNILTGNLYGVSVQGGFSNLVQGNNITGNIVGIQVFKSSGNKIVENELRKGESGLDLWPGAQANFVARNLIANNTLDGIAIIESNNNLITENNIEYNNRPAPFRDSGGITIQNATGNRFHHNNIRFNDVQAFAVFPPGDVTGNTWDDGSRGNYWSDYAGLDDGSDGRPAGDGVGDTSIPHPCPQGGQPCTSPQHQIPGMDYYPLMSIWVPPSLNATAGAQPLNGFPPLQVSFTSQAVGGVGPYSYSWSFGDGTAGQGPNIDHTYSSRGNYIATVTVTDSLGTERSDSVAITVLNPYGNLVLTVVDEAGKPIAGAEVKSLAQPQDQGQLSARTNATGLASFIDLKPGNYTIEASSPGFGPGRKDMVLRRDETLNEKLTLTRIPQGFPLTLLAGGIGAGAGLGLGLFWWRRSRKTKTPRQDPQGTRA